MTARPRPEMRHFTTDVLVIGGGGAGVLAAVGAARSGASTILACKGKAGRSGATPTAGADFMADAASVINVLGFPEGDHRDSPDEFMLDVVKEGKYLNNQRVVEVYVRDAPYRIKEMIGWGMTVTNIEHAHGSRFPRGVMSTGPDIGRALRQALRQHSIPMHDDVMAIDLLLHEGRVVGAVALDQHSGGMIVYHAGAVVLGTGGWQMAYPWTSGTDDLTGDGQAMAYRAGAELADMEMMQFLPGIVINPPAWRRSIYIYALPMGLLYNRFGELFLRRWNPEMVDHPLAHWPKEVAALAIKTEVLEGRGSPAGGVYFSLKHLPANLIDDAAARQHGGRWKADRLDTGAMLDFLKAGNALEVTGDAAHYATGGIRIDENCATSLPGLYAAGECTSGCFGAQRVCSAVSEMIVEGHIAGCGAAAFVRQHGCPEPEGEAIAQAAEVIYAPWERGEGSAPLQLRQAFQKVVGDKVGVVRDEAALQAALAEFSSLAGAAAEQATISKTLRYNREWFEALQLRNLLDVMDVSARSALLRRESRGGHYRRDYPVQDNDHWLVNIGARRGEHGPELRETPVVVTKIQPPAGVMTYVESCRR